MKKKLRILCLALGVLLLAGLSAGCASAKKASDESMASTAFGSEYLVSPDTTVNEKSAVAEASDNAETGTAAAGSGLGSDGTNLSLPSDSRKIILTADVTMESKEYDTALSALLAQVEQLGGYVASRDDTSYGNRYVQLSVCVPSDKFDSFLSGLSDVANVTHLSQSSQDVTDSYIETQSYIDSLTTQQTRLLELMAQAESLQDILDIEDRLAEVRTQLQYYSSLKNSYDAQIDYSTVTISLSEVVDYTIAEPTFGEQLLHTLKTTAENFVTFLREALFVLIRTAPYLVIIAVIVLLAVRGARRRKHRRAAAAPAARPAPSVSQPAAPAPQAPADASAGTQSGDAK